MPNKNMIVVVLVVILVAGVTTGLLLAFEAESPSPAALSGASAAGPATPAGITRAPAESTLGTWPILRHDSGHTGFNPDVGSFRPPVALMDTIALKDTGSEDEALMGVIEIVTGPQRIYAMGQHVMWGIKKDDPSSQWRNDDCIPDQTSGDMCFNQNIAYAASRLVIIRQNFFLSTLDFGYELLVLHAATGLKDWSLPLGDAIPAMAMEGNDILLLTEDGTAGHIRRISLSNDEAYSEEADVEGSLDSGAVVAAGRFIYARDDRILAYNTADGSQDWVYTPTLQADDHGYDLVATEDAVLVSQGGRVIKLDIANRTEEWESEIESGCSSPLQPFGAATNGQIVAVTAVCDDQVVGLDYSNGNEEWRKDIGPIGSPSTIALGGDTLFVASITTPYFNLFALNPNTGAELEKLELHLDDPEFDTSSVLAISDGLLLMASNRGKKILNRFERMPADLSAELETGSLPACGASVGGALTFNFLVTNHGPGTTDNTRADLTLPDGQISLETSQGSCTGGAAPFCELGSLAVNQSVQITASVVLSTAGSFSPGISLSGAVRDPDESNDSDSQPLTVDPASPAGLDLMLTDIEITQGIQNLANEVPLVNGKPTFVRVYGRTNGDPVRNVSAVLHGEVELTGEDLGTLSPIPAAACQDMDGDTPDRDRLSESFVFQLPPSWLEGGVLFTAEINPDGSIPDVQPANDTLTIARGFTRLPRVCLQTYPVRTTGRETSTSPETDNLFPDPWSIADDVGNILTRAFTMLPVREIKVYPSSHLIEEWEPFAEGGWGPYEMDKDEDNRGDVLDTLWWLNLFGDDPDLCDADDSRTHYVGMVHQGTKNTVGSAGLGELDGDELMLFLNTGPNGPQRFDDPHGGLTLAHEIGHNYDRKHVSCGKPKNPDFWYPKDRDRCNIGPIDARAWYGLEFRDPTAPVVITPTMAGDVMSYADDVWPSEYTWEAIQDVLCEENGCTFPTYAEGLDSAATSPAPAETLVDPITGDVLVIRGVISPTIGLDDAYRLPVDQMPKAAELWAQQQASQPVTVTYALNLINGTTILHSEPFTPTHADDQQTEHTSFGLVVPWDPATAHVELVVGDSTAISLTVSASAPVVTSLSPDGGESFTDTLPIFWTASDADGDDLRYTVLYSGDGGGSWKALATSVETNTLTIDSTLLPGSAGQSLIKVVASDGLNTGYRQSAAGFSLPDRKPRAMIYFPADGGAYPSGSMLILRGAIYDPEDDYLPAAVMSWTLSGTGLVGLGDNIVLEDLADGNYSLTLSAADSRGQTGSKTISFRIGEEQRVYLPALLKQ